MCPCAVPGLLTQRRMDHGICVLTVAPSTKITRDGVGNYQDSFRPRVMNGKTTFRRVEGLYECASFSVNVTHVRQEYKELQVDESEVFIGLAFFFRRVISNFSSIMTLLTELQYKGKSFVVEKEADTESAFSVFIGVQAVKHWRHYLFPKEFVLFTAHDSLVFAIKDKVSASHKDRRWLDFLRSLLLWCKTQDRCVQSAANALSRRSKLLVSMQVDVARAGVIRVVRFRKKGKLAPRFIGPFKITGKIGPVAYRLRLPEELNGVHDTFHVSNLKKCLADPTLQIPLYEIQVNAMLNFVEEPVEILERVQ
ncbi:putative reverse transcriptase domain-containing protein [Tanacetum coccineum]